MGENSKIQALFGSSWPFVGEKKLWFPHLSIMDPPHPIFPQKVCKIHQRTFLYEEMVQGNWKYTLNSQFAFVYNINMHIGKKKLHSPWEASHQGWVWPNLLENAQFLSASKSHCQFVSPKNKLNEWFSEETFLDNDRCQYTWCCGSVD